MFVAMEMERGARLLELGPGYRVAPDPDFFAEVKAPARRGRRRLTVSPARAPRRSTCRRPGAGGRRASPCPRRAPPARSERRGGSRTTASRQAAVADAEPELARHAPAGAVALLVGEVLRVCRSRARRCSLATMRPRAVVSECSRGAGAWPGPVPPNRPKSFPNITTVSKIPRLASTRSKRMHARVDERRGGAPPRRRAARRRSRRPRARAAAARARRGRRRTPASSTRPRTKRSPRRSPAGQRRTGAK